MTKKIRELSELSLRLRLVDAIAKRLDMDPILQGLTSWAAFQQIVDNAACVPLSQMIPTHTDHKDRPVCFEKQVLALRFAVCGLCSMILGLTAHQKTSQHTYVEPCVVEAVLRLYDLYIDDSVLAVRYMKFKTSYIAAVLLGQSDDDLPVLAENLKPHMKGGKLWSIGGGWLFILLKKLISLAKKKSSASSRDSLRLKTIAMNILQSKKGAPPVDKSFVEAVLDKHAKGLTEVRPRVESKEEIKDKVRSRIKEIVHRIYGGTTFEPRTTMPSLNASFWSRRNEGGAMGELLRGWFISQCEVVEDYLKEGEMLRISHTLSDGGLRRAIPVDIPGLDLEKSFQDYIDSLCKEYLDDDRKVNARSAPIIEPNKVRVVTAEEAAVSTRCTEIQKFIHTRLKSFFPFQYIGMPIDKRSFNKHFGRKLKDDEAYMSGDYEGATDNLDPEISAYTWDCIAKEVNIPVLIDGTTRLSKLYDSIYYTLGYKDLVGHDMYKPTEEGLVHVGHQAWGQLMGAPASFPILCLVNVAASSLALDYSTDDIFREDCPLVVNGDDLAVIIRQDQYAQWKEWTAACGLAVSIGKNYLSRDFLIMNSECWIPSNRNVEMGPRTEFDIDWKLLPFVNQALLLGFEMKGPDSGKDLKATMNWTELGTRCEELVYGVEDNSYKEFLVDWFVAIHRDILKLVPRHVSWYVATHLGGVGLPYTDGRTITESSARMHTLVHTLSPGERSKLTSYPKRETKSLLEEWSDEAEQYYKKYCHSWWTERSVESLTLESWGFPSPREESPLGTRLRLAYILSKFVGWMNETIIVEVKGRTVSHHRYDFLCYVQGNSPYTIGQLLAKDAPSFVLGTAMIQAYFSLEACLSKGAVKKMCSAEQGKLRSQLQLGSRGENLKYNKLSCQYYSRWSRMYDQAINHFPSDRLHVMDIAKLTAWAPPLIEVVDYPDLLEDTCPRFTVYSKQTHNRTSDPKTTSKSWIPSVLRNMLRTSNTMVINLIHSIGACHGQSVLSDTGRFLRRSIKARIVRTDIHLNSGVLGRGDLQPLF